MGNKAADARERRAPRGHFVVYVGIDELKRYVVPLSHLKNPSFQRLMHNAAEEFGFNTHKRIVLPCHESEFIIVTSSLGRGS